jgi:hypothetical protein
MRAERYHWDEMTIGPRRAADPDLVALCLDMPAL